MAPHDHEMHGPKKFELEVNYNSECTSPVDPNWTLIMPFDAFFSYLHDDIRTILMMSHDKGRTFIPNNRMARE